MANMFNGATAFNQPIGDWDVFSVTNIGGMFNGALHLIKRLEIGMCFQFRLCTICSTKPLHLIKQAIGNQYGMFLSAQHLIKRLVTGMLAISNEHCNHVFR